MERMGVMGGLVLLLVGCSGNPRPTPPPLPPPMQAVDVVVTDSRSGAPIEGVWIECQGIGWGHTNGDGYFLRSSVPSNIPFDCELRGERLVTARVEGFVPTPTNYRIVVGMERDGVMVADPVIGRLRIGGGCFRDDTGCRLPFYAHFGNGLSLYIRDPERARQELDGVAEANHLGVRVWSTLGCDGGTCGDPNAYWYGREVGPLVTPNYWSKVSEFFNELKERGLRAVWSQGDVRALGDRRAAMSEFARRGNGVIDFIDCGNEAYQTGEPDPQRLAQCIGYYQEAGGWGLKSTTDVPIYPPYGARWEDWVLPPSDVYDIHSMRDGHVWDKRRHIWSYGYENPPPVDFGIGSEGPGPGWRVSAIANQHELDDEGMAMLAVASVLGRQAYVWFSGQGVILEGGLHQEAGFQSVPRALSLLPRDVMTYETIHHSGAAAWGHLRVLEAQGEVRIDGRQANDGRFAYTIDGPPGTYHLRVARGFEGKICHPSLATCEAVSRRAGETLEVSFLRGRVFIGTIR